MYRIMRQVGLAHLGCTIDHLESRLELVETNAEQMNEKLTRVESSIEQMSEQMLPR